MPTRISLFHPVLPQLRKAVETAFGRNLQSQSNIWDFIEAIHHQLNEDTIRRLWGQRKDAYTTVRRSTLDILSRYAGAKDWDNFVQTYQSEAGVESDLHTHMQRIGIEELQIGDRIEFTWLPDRECIAEYNGNAIFRVIMVKNSNGLACGDTFLCRVFVVGEILLLDQLTRNGNVLGCYRAGISNGLSSVRLLHCEDLY